MKVESMLWAATWLMMNALLVMVALEPMSLAQQKSAAPADHLAATA